MGDTRCLNRDGQMLGAPQGPETGLASRVHSNGSREKSSRSWSEATMKKREVSEVIFAELGSILLPAGFIGRKSDWSFSREFPGGRYRVGNYLYDYNPEFHFGAHLCTRIDAVTQIPSDFQERRTRGDPVSPRLRFWITFRPRLGCSRVRPYPRSARKPPSWRASCLKACCPSWIRRTRCRL
jgi:hypothetical protein